MSELITKAGRALALGWGGMDDMVVAIEQEAIRDDRERIAARVRARWEESGRLTPPTLAEVLALITPEDHEPRDPSWVGRMGTLDD